MGLQELLEHIHKPQNWQPLQQSLFSENISIAISVTYQFHYPSWFKNIKLGASVERKREIKSCTTSCTYLSPCPPTTEALVSKYSHQLLHHPRDNILRQNKDTCFFSLKNNNKNKKICHYPYSLSYKIKNSDSKNYNFLCSIISVIAWYHMVIWKIFYQIPAKILIWNCIVHTYTVIQYHFSVIWFAIIIDNKQKIL